MKKYIFFFIALLILSNRSFANNPSNAEETQQLILNELRIIKEIQDSTYKQRMKAAEARKKASKDPSTTLPAEYSVLTGIETNTRSNFLYDSWNSYGIIALLFSICALFFTGKQYFSQKQTEMNTRESEKHSKNAPISVQLGKLEDLPRHFYRNLVCSGAIIFKHKHTSNGSSGNRNNYPSESNFRKLQTLPDDIFLPIDIEEESYKMMHELRLLFRNYNMEVLVASEHVSRRNLTDKSLENDFDNMLFKPFHLTKEALPYEKLLKPEVINQNKNTVDTIIFEHFKKLHTNITTLMRKDQSSYLKDLLNQKPDDNSGYIKTIIDEKGAIARSMKTFAEVKGSKKDIMNLFEKSSKELQEFIKAITDGTDSFIEWCHDNNIAKDITTDIDKQDKSIHNLGDSIKYYLDYLNSDDWDFKTLLYYMLAIDIAIETDRIGMINY